MELIHYNFKVKDFFKKRFNKIKHDKNCHFSALFLPKKNYFGNKYFFLMEKKSQENKLFMNCDGQHLVIFLDHTNMPNCP